MSRRSVILIVAMALAVLWMRAGAAEVIQCSPVSTEDQILYNDWGWQQDPPLEWVDCAQRCDHGLRLCRFRMRPPSASERLLFATCNGRHAGPACRLAP